MTGRARWPIHAAIKKIMYVLYLSGFFGGKQQGWTLANFMLQKTYISKTQGSSWKLRNTTVRLQKSGRWWGCVLLVAGGRQRSDNLVSALVPHCVTLPCLKFLRREHLIRPAWVTCPVRSQIGSGTMTDRPLRLYAYALGKSWIGEVNLVHSF